LALVTDIVQLINLYIIFIMIVTTQLPVLV